MTKNRSIKKEILFFFFKNVTFYFVSQNLMQLCFVFLQYKIEITTIIKCLDIYLNLKIVKKVTKKKKWLPDVTNKGILTL